MSERARALCVDLPHTNEVELSIFANLWEGEFSMDSHPDRENLLSRESPWIHDFHITNSLNTVPNPRTCAFPHTQWLGST